jgi:branched-chain amino acid aminotransferase
MQVNFNGQLMAVEVPYLPHGNRGLYVGDAVFESLRVMGGKAVFWEDHYLRLMSSMRMLRMEIPMAFTMEFLANEIKTLLEANDLLAKTCRVRLTVFRKAGGRYMPNTNEIDYLLEVSALENAFYILNDTPYEVELFKDYYVNNDLLSTLKTNNKALHVVAGVFAQENGYANCLLINGNKHVVEAINANLFLVKGDTVATPPLSDGALNGIIRQKLMEVIGNMEGKTLEERSISPFELQKADELFLTNAIQGILPVTKYRKKQYQSNMASELIGKLNTMARLSVIEG